MGCYSANQEIGLNYSISSYEHTG